jgi:hypothetical protein
MASASASGTSAITRPLPCWRTTQRGASERELSVQGDDRRRVRKGRAARCGDDDGPAGRPRGRHGRAVVDRHLGARDTLGTRGGTAARGGAARDPVGGRRGAATQSSDRRMAAMTSACSAADRGRTIGAGASTVQVSPRSSMAEDGASRSRPPPAAALAPVSAGRGVSGCTSVQAAAITTIAGSPIRTSMITSSITADASPAQGSVLPRRAPVIQYQRRIPAPNTRKEANAKGRPRRTAPFKLHRRWRDHSSSSASTAAFRSSLETSFSVISDISKTKSTTLSSKSGARICCCAPAFFCTNSKKARSCPGTGAPAP